MARIVWTEPALTDLDDVAEYIALDNIEAAKKLVKNVFTSVKRLSRFPKSGRIPPEFRTSQYREVIVGPCRVFYRIDGNTIYILYVMRGESHLRKYLLQERHEANYS